VEVSEFTAVDFQVGASKCMAASDRFLPDYAGIYCRFALRLCPKGQSLFLRSA